MTREEFEAVIDHLDMSSSEAERYEQKLGGARTTEAYEHAHGWYILHHDNTTKDATALLAEFDRLTAEIGRQGDEIIKLGGGRK